MVSKPDETQGETSMKPFEQAAKNLIERLHNTNDANDQEIIREFLVLFAEHILWHTTPASGCSIRQYLDMTIEEMAQSVKDMQPGQTTGFGE